MSKFRNRVLFIVQNIPFGKVASYGQVALYAGLPRAARQVGWILNQSEGKVDLPWWRVINNAGIITTKGTRFNDRETQRKLLISEGISVNKDFELDIKAHRWHPSAKLLKNFQLSEKYLDSLAEKVPYSKPRVP